jgi:hypothetical protein
MNWLEQEKVKEIIFDSLFRNRNNKLLKNILKNV